MTTSSLLSRASVLLVAAHPDDETLFAVARFSACRTLCIVHTTDGATSRRAARANRFSSRAAYAPLRDAADSATSLASGDCAFVAAEAALHRKLDVLYA